MQHLQHYVLTLNPKATFDWDRCTLRHPLSADHPSLAALVQEAIGETEGQFLVSVELTVTVLETVALPPEPCLPAAPMTETDAPTVDVHATESLPAVSTP